MKTQRQPFTAPYCICQEMAPCIIFSHSLYKRVAKRLLYTATQSFLRELWTEVVDAYIRTGTDIIKPKNQFPDLIRRFCICTWHGTHHLRTSVIKIHERTLLCPFTNVTACEEDTLARGLQRVYVDRSLPCESLGKCYSFYNSQPFHPFGWFLRKYYFASNGPFPEDGHMMV